MLIYLGRRLTRLQSLRIYNEIFDFLTKRGEKI